MAPFGRRRTTEARRGTPADVLAVGLGNPGADYVGSRHNVGADTVLLLAERHGARLRREKHAKADTDECVVDGRRLALAVPLTYMNESGLAVAPLCRRFGVDDLTRLVIVHDEVPNT